MAAQNRPAVTQEQVAEDFDRLTDEYETKINKAISFGGNEHQFYIDVKRDHIIRLVEAELGSPASLKALDLGCGIGAYHAGLESRFGELHGVDVSAKSVEMAMRSHPNGHYKVSSGDTLLIWRILGRRASQSGPSGRM